MTTLASSDRVAVLMVFNARIAERFAAKLADEFSFVTISIVTDQQPTIDDVTGFHSYCQHITATVETKQQLRQVRAFMRGFQVALQASSLIAQEYNAERLN